jgi:hypothetical protein
MLSRNWFPGRLREVQGLAPRRLGKDKHFISSTSFAVCCMTCLASLPSGVSRLYICLRDRVKMACVPSMTSVTLVSTALTSSRTLWVAFKTCAVAIRASSCVNLSSLFSASSKSVLPTSLLRYFSQGSFSQASHIYTGITHSSGLASSPLSQSQEWRGPPP